jgi:hypothetical protein
MIQERDDAMEQLRASQEEIAGLRQELKVCECHQPVLGSVMVIGLH